ncbi:hypothetical protein ABH944_005431 [Caballeronia udeis]|uniref:MobA/VirD2-like nuclease domain-containing protein n=1 Tax=Caballeronia udeis TaxID=1232866 RepID=A0ABW8MNG1_9BURK
MIPFASQRGGGQDLATHLLNDYDNDMAEVVEVRGAVAHDLHGAFKEWEVQADTLTHCRKYLYSLSINPDPRQGPLTREQYMDYIRRTEDALGLGAQPRAVVFHVKYGREHCHVVWSRIDADQQRAIHLAFDRDKLMRVTRAFARDHRLDLPAGYDKSRGIGQISLYEQEQLRRTGLSKANHKQEVTDAWRQSDDARAFVQALAERGYMLATGKRPYVLVDLYGGMHALPKLIDDKTVRTKDIRAFLEKDFPCDGLPSVEEARQLASEHRRIIEQSVQESRHSDRLEQLKHSQMDRRAAVERERDTLKHKQRALRFSQEMRQRAERDRLRSDHRAHMDAIRQERRRNQPTGLAAFLGRISGFALLQKTLRRHHDKQEARTYIERRQQLGERQRSERSALDCQLAIQAKEIERRAAALEKIDRRELAALRRDIKREVHVRARDGDQVMPSLTRGSPKQPHGAIPDVLDAFSRASRESNSEVPDLMAAFERAARTDGDDGGEDGSGDSLDRSNSFEPTPPDRPRRRRNQDRER